MESRSKKWILLLGLPLAFSTGYWMVLQRNSTPAVIPPISTKSGSEIRVTPSLPLPETPPAPINFSPPPPMPKVVGKKVNILYDGKKIKTFEFPPPEISCPELAAARIDTWLSELNGLAPVNVWSAKRQKPTEFLVGGKKWRRLDLAPTADAKPHLDRMEAFLRLREMVTDSVGEADFALETMILKEGGGLEARVKGAFKNGFPSRVAAFDTTFDPKNLERTQNLRVAIQKIDGLILEPGSEFSFNRILGPRTRENGYRTAGVISGGKVVPGLGGGICQISSTLYNLVLQLNLPVRERFNHSIFTPATNYVPIGLDAAVVYGAKDFRFVNDLDFPIVLIATLEEDRVRMAFMASQTPERKVELLLGEKRIEKGEMVIKKTRALKRGEQKVIQEPVDGWTVTNFLRVTYPDGKVEKRPITTDRYQTYHGIIQKGI